MTTLYCSHQSTPACMPGSLCSGLRPENARECFNRPPATTHSSLRSDWMLTSTDWSEHSGVHDGPCHVPKMLRHTFPDEYLVAQCQRHLGNKAQPRGQVGVEADLAVVRREEAHARRPRRVVRREAQQKEEKPALVRRAVRPRHQRMHLGYVVLVPRNAASPAYHVTTEGVVGKVAARTRRRRSASA